MFFRDETVWKIVLQLFIMLQNIDSLNVKQLFYFCSSLGAGDLSVPKGHQRPALFLLH